MSGHQHEKKSTIGAPEGTIEPVILSGTPKRLGIYFFYDPHGVVDDYVVTFLEGMMPSLTRLVVVVNGKLTREGRERFEKVGADPVVVRPNEGFDVWAYKAGLDLVGWEALAEYDELIMVNFTIMGPVGSFEPMFAEMDSRDVDFWGITIHNGAEFDPWDKMPDGSVDVHLQSHFIAVRRRMLASPEFRRYWDTMVPIETYEDSIARHEALFTPRFADMGFTWDYYVDTSDLIGEMYYPLFNTPVDLIVNRRSPIFKRKTFIAAPDLYLDENSNRPARDLLDYLAESGDYDIDLIWRHVIRSGNHFDVATALNLFTVIDSHGSAETASSTTVGAIVGVESAADLERRLRDLEALPPSAKLLVVHPIDAPGLEDAEALLSTGRWADAVVKTIPVQSDPWSVLEHYDGELRGIDLICIVDPAQRGTFPYSNGTAADRNTTEAVLASPAYVSRVIELFDENPLLGLAVPPRSLHSDYYGNYGHEWADSFADVAELLSELEIETPLDKWKSPLSPAEGKAWLRGSVLDSELFTQARDTAGSATVLEKSTPFLAQALGFFSSVIMPDGVASNLITNATHMLRRNNQRFGIGVGDRFSAFEFRLQARQFGPNTDWALAPTKAYLYIDTGDGFSQRSAVSAEAQPVLGSAGLEFRFDVPPGTKAVRFDPTEGLGCICIGTRATTESGQTVPLRPVNGTRRGRFDVFETADPSYVGYSWPRRERQLIVTMESMTVLRPPFAGEFRRGFWGAAWYKLRRALGRIG